MSYFVNSISAKSEKWNVETNIQFLKLLQKKGNWNIGIKIQFSIISKPRSSDSISQFSKFLISIS